MLTDFVRSLGPVKQRQQSPGCSLVTTQTRWQKLSEGFVQLFFWVLLWLGGTPSPQSISGRAVVLTVFIGEGKKKEQILKCLTVGVNDIWRSEQSKLCFLYL